MVGHGAAQNLIPSNSTVVDQNGIASPESDIPAREKYLEAHRAQLVGLDHEHPDQVLNSLDVVVLKPPAERAILTDLLQPPDFIADDGRVVLFIA